MDTLVNSTVITMSDDLGRALNNRIEEIIAEVEGRISKTLETSEIYELNYYAKISDIRPFMHSDLSEETFKLLELAKTVQDATNGGFNPCLGDIIDLWGINDSDREHALPQRDEFFRKLELLHTYGYKINKNITGEFVLEAMHLPKIDLGAIAKGYALDHVNDYLESESIQNALVSFESSILALGRDRAGELWSIGVKDPVNPEKLAGVINASDKFISVSAGYERYITIDGIKYIHIIDPETGYPVNNDLLCVVVIMDAKSVSMPRDRRERFINNGALSDALSTALYVMGRQKALDFYASGAFDFEMILYARSESDPRGYEILSTNVIFNEIE